MDGRWGQCSSDDEGTGVFILRSRYGFSTDDLAPRRSERRFASSCCCTASSRCSCSHRVIRRSDPGVHWDLIEQFLQVLVQ